MKHYGVIKTVQCIFYWSYGLSILKILINVVNLQKSGSDPVESKIGSKIPVPVRSGLPDFLV